MTDLRELLYRITTLSDDAQDWDEAREIGQAWLHEQELRKLFAAPGFDLISFSEEVGPTDSFAGGRIRKITIYERKKA